MRLKRSSSLGCRRPLLHWRIEARPPPDRKVNTVNPNTSHRARVTLPILGLTCGGGGALSVERSLLRVPGVIWAYVNPATEMAYVEYDPEQTNQEALREAVEWSGYRTVLPEPIVRRRPDQSGEG